ncbi:hypothetical protein AFUB_097630 [Aspergillus fumigatus A1163]|uniref:Uncharacterized protein n=1 Tax=Aspergillus fumigatus (strain CBS 144.89 / FGSC A1163 / CEA10) TaxID=451804 RepID=B0YE28_ASPFC|nr:hypothetical protein AFUB_097630 [Aspergillus fumigatus A1163]
MPSNQRGFGQQKQEITSGKYSKEDTKSLNRHRKVKYPHLMLAILAYVLETGCSPDGADIDDFGERVNKALAADREEAAQDNCIWASMEWRWQEHANRPKRSRRNGQRQRLTARLGINRQPQISTANAYKGDTPDIYRYCEVYNPGNHLCRPFLYSITNSLAAMGVKLRRI